MVRQMGDILNMSRSLSLHGLYDTYVFKSVVKVGPHTTLAYSKCGLTKDL